MLTRSNQSTGGDKAAASTARFHELDRIGMKSSETQAAAGQGSPGKTPSEYESLLVAAQAAQARADRAVADLAALKRSVAELPRTIETRRAEFERARLHLEKLESEMREARERIPAKQAEAAQAIEEAANSQRALAHALIQDDANLDAAQIQELSAASRPAPVVREPASASDSRQSAARAASAPYFSPAATPAHEGIPKGTFIPPPSNRPAQENSEDVIAYMVDRDLLCPSCGSPLRGVKRTKCPGCGLSLSVPVMRSVAPGLLDAQPAVWAIRIIGIIAIGLALFLGLSVMSSGRPKGCGVGSDCHFVVSSPWSKIFGVPVSIPGILLYAGILVTTFFTRVGLRDVTRRRAWMLLCIAGAVTALSGVWFVIIQTVILKAFCPFCLTVDLMGILTGVLVLLRAPLGRREPLPTNAIGAIAFPRSLNVKLLATGSAIALAFIGVHYSANGSKTSDRKAFTQQQMGQPEKKDDGLMMGGLEIREKPTGPRRIDLSPKTDPEPTVKDAGTKKDATVKPKPTEPAGVKTKPAAEDKGGLLLPGLEVKPESKSESPAKSEAPAKALAPAKPDSGAPTPVSAPSASKPDPAKQPDADAVKKAAAKALEVKPGDSAIPPFQAPIDSDLKTDLTPATSDSPKQ